MVTVSPARLEEVAASIFRDDGQNVFSDLLEPCPFCGSDHAHRGGGDDYSGPYVQVGPAFGFEGVLVDARVVCNTCHVSTSRSTASEARISATDESVTRLTAIALAIGDWNRRHRDDLSDKKGQEA